MDHWMCFGHDTCICSVATGLSLCSSRVSWCHHSICHHLTCLNIALRNLYPKTVYHHQSESILWKGKKYKISNNENATFKIQNDPKLFHDSKFFNAFRVLDRMRKFCIDLDPSQPCILQITICWHLQNIIFQIIRNVIYTSSNLIHPHLHWEWKRWKVGLLPTSFMHLLVSPEENILQVGMALTTDQIITWELSIARVASETCGHGIEHHLLIPGMLSFRDRTYNIDR